MSIFQPEDQQMEICLAQSHLQDIERALVEQKFRLPELDAENEKKRLETLSLLHEVRSLYANAEKLNLDNVTKSAKLLQLKKQYEDLANSMEQVRSEHNELANLIKEEENYIEMHIRKYEESLKKKAEKFRQTKIYYNENKMIAEVNESSKKIIEFQNLLQVRRNIVDKLKKRLEDMSSNLPDNLLTICGKPALDKKLKEVTEKYEALMQEMKTLQMNQ